MVLKHKEKRKNLRDNFKRLRDDFFMKFFGGHLSIGKKITFFGENAMSWAVEIQTKKWGYVVFKPPIRTYGEYHGWWLYFSPNATPWACTYYIGHTASNEKIKSKIRKSYFGHNFNSEKRYEELIELNNKMSDQNFINDFKKKLERREKLKKINEQRRLFPFW
jgi:hypothetical protein